MPRAYPGCDLPPPRIRPQPESRRPQTPVAGAHIHRGLTRRDTRGWRQGRATAHPFASLDRLLNATAFEYVGYHWAFDVTRDGKFVYLGPAGSAKPAAAQLVEVDNWFADIQARLKP